MYYKDVEEDFYQPGYEMSRAEVMTWAKSPMGMLVIAVVLAIIVFLIWWFFIRTQQASVGKFSYY